MNRADMWTDEEIEIIERNYPKYGFAIDDWDTKIGRSKGAVRAKALRMGLACAAKFGSRLKASDRKKLRVVADGLCENLNLSMRELAREIAVFANEETVNTWKANKLSSNNGR